MKANTYIKHNRNINKTGLLSAFTFLLLALTCLFPISKSEQTTEAVTGTVQSSSLTLNVSSSAASVELDVNSNTGTFASSSSDNSAAFSVTTNNFSGYTLSISGSDNDGRLYDKTKQYSLEPLTSAVSEADFSSTSSLNGKWGYKPSKFNSIANANYLPAPTTTASTLDTTSVANPTANNYTISLGLRADYTTTANTYSNSFIITAVPNPIAYVITYDANTTDTVSNMPASQNSTTSATEITLSDKTPAREGYDFKGWCTTAPTTTNPDTCAGTTFQPGDTYGIDQTSENITVLYAIWKKQIIYIQDYSYAQCSTETVDAPATVVDKRDNKEYTVRYINGLCTMTQNLKIDAGQVMTPADTNIASDYIMTTDGFEIGESYTEARIHETGREDYGNHYNYCAATAGTICDSTTVEATYDICPKGWRLPTAYEQRDALTNGIWQTWVTNYPTSFNVVASGGMSASGPLGDPNTIGYWWSSTASNTTRRYNLYYSTSDGLRSGSSNSRYYGYSVRCVKAKPGVTISFNANGGTGTMNMQKIDAGQSANLTANTFTRTDYVFTGWNTKADGSGTSYSNAATYTAPTSEDNKIVVLYAQWAGNYLGVAPSLQEVTTAHCTNSYDGATATQTDVRDGKTYTIAKINGICTMIDNLRVDKGQAMTPADTNINSNWTMTDRDLTTGDNSYDLPEIHEGDATTGHWYNYAAATAGTITGSSNTTEATQDICPKGWRLPAGGNTSTGYEQKLLTNNKFQAWQSIGTFDDSFKVAAGNYYGGSLGNSGSSGSWWSSTAYNTTGRYYLYYNTSSGLRSGSNVNRYFGFSVRCVLK